MTKGIVVAIALMAVGVCVVSAIGQQKTEKASNPVRLELTSEVAATTEEGYPAVLRVTLTNVGNMAVDMPMPNLGCISEDGGLQIGFILTSLDGKSGVSGWCGGGSSDRPRLLNRARDEWIRLQPGEFIVASESLRPHLKNLGPGTVEYWIEYTPLSITPTEMAELTKAGYFFPTEKIETPRETFDVR
jgi:hypothetical protein